MVFTVVGFQVTHGSAVFTVFWKLLSYVMIYLEVAVF